MGFDLGGALSDFGSGIVDGIKDTGDKLSHGDIGGALESAAGVAGDSFGIPGINTQVALLTGDFKNLPGAASQDLLNFKKSAGVAQAVMSGDPAATFKAATAFGKVKMPGVSPPSGTSYAPKAITPYQQNLIDSVLKEQLALVHPIAAAHASVPDMAQKQALLAGEKIAAMKLQAAVQNKVANDAAIKKAAQTKKIVIVGGIAALAAILVLKGK